MNEGAKIIYYVRSGIVCVLMQKIIDAKDASVAELPDIF
jgi:hypothetical protein